MGELSNFKVGQTVELQDGRIAVVRYVGDAHFAAGDWVGVELDDNSGKNDGSVQGQRYFDCEPGRGMFVRPGVAAIIDQPTPRPIKTTGGIANGAAARPRQSISAVGALRRQSVLDTTASKRQSINGGSPTPSARSTASSRPLRSPSKSPTKQIVSRPASGIVDARHAPPLATTKPTALSTASRTNVSGRPSIGPNISTASRPPRQSMLGSLNGPTKQPLPSTRRPANRLSTLQQGQPRSSSVSDQSQTSGGSGQESPADSMDRELLSPHSETYDQRSRPGLSPATSRASAMSRATASPNMAPSRTRPSPAESNRPPGTPPIPSTVMSREIEDLKTKLRVMEKKRIEDRDKLKALDKIQGERDKFEGIIQKLQAKYQPQQQEIIELRRQIKEAESKATADENQQADIDAAMEMATLDREMAEETAEALKTELDALRQKTEELELEVEILREENSELGKEMSPEERTSQGWIQMERSNERLREALLRLRDVKEENEAEFKQQVKELEIDIKELGNFRNLYQDAKERLVRSEATVEDLRQQLETVLGAEEMIEELTEKNLALNERIEEFKIVIEDLESLKELNDELEINHIETEKQMQDEIDYKELVLQEQVKKSSIQDETIEDLEYTVSRFRDLVTNLQSDLEDMRASQQITEIEANELSSRSRAMLDLNMRLQISATKAQVKAIDLELERLQAQQSAEHLTIVQLFLPDTFKNERESINAHLRFKRVGFKASVLHTFVKERLNNPSVSAHKEDIFACCDILDKLTWISAMCERFSQFVYSCSLEEFERLRSAYYDLDPVERALNSWIEGLKRDELKEQQCAAELQRSIALMSHLAETHLSDGLAQLAEDIHMRAVIMLSNLENAAVALATIKLMAYNTLSPLVENNQEESEAVQNLAQKADLLISQIRSAKVVTSKTAYQLKELKSRALTLDPCTLPIIEQSQASTWELVHACRESGLSLVKLMNLEGRTSSLLYEEVVTAISPADTSPFSALSSKTSAAVTQMQSFYNLATTLSQTVEFSTSAVPPWELLSQKLRAESNTSASHEREVGRLKDELAEKNTALAIKEKIVEEMSVNVEVLEKRVGESSGRREKLRELEGLLNSSRSKERDTAKKLVRLEEDLRALEAEREGWKKRMRHVGNLPGSHDTYDDHHSAAHDEAFPAKAHQNIAQLRAEIENLKSTIRHLRLTNYNTSLNSSHTFLNVPLLPKRTATTQTRLSHEAHDVLRSMMAIITKPGNQVVQLPSQEKGARLNWRPAQQTCKWQVGRQREEWEAWRDWRDDVVKKSKVIIREGTRVRQVVKEKGEVVARAGVWIPDLGPKRACDGREVRIARPEDWEELERSLGVT